VVEHHVGLQQHHEEGHTQVDVRPQRILPVQHALAAAPQVRRPRRERDPLALRRLRPMRWRRRAAGEPRSVSGGGGGDGRRSGGGSSSGAVAAAAAAAAAAEARASWGSGVTE